MTSAESREVYFLRQVEKQEFSKDFGTNLVQLNQTTKSLFKYLVVMQKGIDEANMNIIQKIQAFINEIITIFTGGEIGSDTGLDFGDLGYIVQALGALFGFGGISGPINLFEAAGHLLENFGGGVINAFIKAVFDILATVLNGVPLVGGSLSAIVHSFADNINDTRGTAVQAGEDAEAAQISASGANAAAIIAQQQAAEARSAAYRNNVSDIFNFEAAAMRTKYPANGGNNGYAYGNSGGVAYSGSWYLKLEPTAGYDAFAWQALSDVVRTDPGEEWFIEWRQKKFGTPAYNAYVHIAFYDASDTFISALGASVAPPTGTAPDIWVLCSTSGLAPANTYTMRVQAYLNLNSGQSLGSGGWYFDDVVAGRIIRKAQVAGLITELAGITNTALAAQEAADIAYANAQHWKDEFLVASAGVQLGKNEVDLGVVMDLPLDGIARVRKITALRYGTKANASTSFTIELRKTNLANVESTIHTTTITGGATKLRDNTIDYTVNDGDYISCNVTNITPSGAVISVLQCAVIGVLIEAP